jgi:siroheme synthase-like protein
MDDETGHQANASPYLAALDLRGRRCVVAGGGAVARRKVEGLLAAGADVLVVAPVIGEMPPGAELARREARLDDLDGVALVVCATDDAGVNIALAKEAQRRGVLVNVVDDPDQGTFTVPAVLRRGRVQVGVSTGGASPLLARKLRDELASSVTDQHAQLAGLLAELRSEWEPAASAAGVPPAERRAAWQAVLDLPLLDLLSGGPPTRGDARADPVAPVCSPWLQADDPAQQVGVEVRLDVVGEAVDVVVGRRRRTLAERQAEIRAEAVEERRAEVGVVEEAVDVAAADAGDGAGTVR